MANGADKPLLTDIAARAGVSLATVDRVVNRRKGVSERTRRRVLEAARAVGYLGDEDILRIGADRALNVTVLLPAGTNPYLRLLGDRVRARLDRAGAGDPFLRCYFIESFNAAALADALRKSAEWSDAIAFFAIEHPEVRVAAAEVEGQGTRLVTLVSNLGERARVAHVGLDNHAAGRTAGLLVGRLSGRDRGRVALVAGSRNYRAHSDREAGFLSLIDEMFPGLSLVGLREGHNDAAENYRHALALLDQQPDLVGIYNVGGSSGGITRALRERGRGDVVFIGHGLSDDTRRALLDGTMDAVLDQDPDTLLERALQTLATTGSRPDPMKLDIYFRENLP